MFQRQLRVGPNVEHGDSDASAVKDEKGGVVLRAPPLRLVNLGTSAERAATTSSEGVCQISQLGAGKLQTWRSRPPAFQKPL